MFFFFFLGYKILYLHCLLAIKFSMYQCRAVSDQFFGSLYFIIFIMTEALNASFKPADWENWDHSEGIVFGSFVFWCWWFLYQLSCNFFLCENFYHSLTKL